MGAEHLSFAKETVWGTFVAPTDAVPVEGASINPTQPLMANEDTGGGRGRVAGAMGELTVNGPINMKLYPTKVPKLLASTYGTRVATAAGTGWRNKMLPNDDVAVGSFSFQKRYGAGLSESIRGAKLNTYTVSARAREFAKLATAWIAKDATATGGTFPDGTAAPATADPTSLYTPLRDALKFYQGVMRTGGTTALTAGEVVVTGGTDRCEFDNISIEHLNNLSNDGFGVCLDDRTVQAIDEGPRVINIRFEPNFRTVGFEFYNDWKDGTPAVVEAYFESNQEFDAGQPYIYKWSFPHVRWTAGANPELNAAYGLKRAQIQGQAFLDPTLLVDHGLVIETSETLV